jgi:chromosome segregation ATPase
MSQWNRHLARRIEELVHKCQILENDNADLHDEIQRQKDLQVSASEAYDEIRDKNTRLVAKIHELHEELGQVRKNEESDVVKIRREASQTIREQDLEIEQLQRENVQTQRKDDEINRLQKEVIQYKRLINTSTHVRGQVSDTTIRDKMNGLFSAVRNWAIGVSRQEKLGTLQ